MPARDYLTPNEQHLVEEFEELYRDVLCRMCPAGEEGPLDEFFADQFTGALWKLRRAGADASQIFTEVVLKRRYAEARANEIIEADVRGRIQALHRRNLEGLSDTRRTLMASLKPKVKAKKPGKLTLVANDE